MNERDKELYQQATGKEWAYDFDVDTAEKFADLIRADERLALDAKDWTAIMREGALVTWGDAEELGERIRAAIRARGDT